MSTFIPSPNKQETASLYSAYQTKFNFPKSASHHFEEFALSHLHSIPGMNNQKSYSITKENKECLQGSPVKHSGPLNKDPDILDVYHKEADIGKIKNEDFWPPPPPEYCEFDRKLSEPTSGNHPIKFKSAAKTTSTKYNTPTKMRQMESKPLINPSHKLVVAIPTKGCSKEMLEPTEKSSATHGKRFAKAPLNEEDVRGTCI